MQVEALRKVLLLKASLVALNPPEAKFCVSFLKRNPTSKSLVNHIVLMEAEKERITGLTTRIVHSLFVFFLPTHCFWPHLEVFSSPHLPQTAVPSLLTSAL